MQIIIPLILGCAIAIICGVFSEKENKKKGGD
jgi:hypothetical protein